MAINGKCLHVFEVKTRCATLSREFSPHAAIDHIKSKQVWNLARRFEQMHKLKLLRSGIKDLRCNLAAVFYLKDSLSGKIAYNIRIYENAI